MSPREDHHLADGRAYRFVRVERLAHWVNAGAFFALVLTGTLLLLRTRLALPPARVRLLHGFHLAFGAVYVCGPALVFLRGGPRHGLRWLLEVFRWTPAELLWLLGPLRRLLPRGVPAPVVGRFNAGQRLNMLAQLAAKWTLAGSGLLMHLRPGQLLMYALHLFCYFVVCALATGHIYLGLLHPATRHSLRAMLGGFVRADWLRHHHPGWFEHLQQRAPEVEEGTKEEQEKEKKEERTSPEEPAPAAVAEERP